MAAAGHAFRVDASGDEGPLGLFEVRVGTAPFADEPLEPEFLDVLRAREVLFRTYDPDADEPVWLFLGYFDRQKEGSQVHSPRHCYPGSGWNIEQEFATPSTWRAGELPALVVSNGMQRRLVRFWYQTPAAVETDAFRLKLALTRQALRHRPQDVVFASISTPIDSGLERAVERTAETARVVEDEIARLYVRREETRP